MSRHCQNFSQRDESIKIRKISNFHTHQRIDFTVHSHRDRCPKTVDRSKTEARTKRQTELASPPKPSFSRSTTIDDNPERSKSNKDDIAIGTLQTAGRSSPFGKNVFIFVGVERELCAKYFDLSPSSGHRFLCFVVHYLLICLLSVLFAWTAVFVRAVMVVGAWC